MKWTVVLSDSRTYHEAPYLVKEWRVAIGRDFVVKKYKLVAVLSAVRMAVYEYIGTGPF